MKTSGCFFVAFSVALSALAGLPALIPAPQSVVWTGGELDCSRYRINSPAGAGFAAAELAGILAGGKADPAGPAINLRLAAINSTNEEAYTLEATSSNLVITASRPAGLLYGVETLRQLLAGTTSLPCCNLADWPAFLWRGFMHDVGRNFQDIALLKRFVDVMARYKFNILHLHLTDNPGWRIECRVHPELNDPKNYSPTRSPGKFYTYAELNDLMAYCAQRGITVVPEIDLPGHSDYFQRAFGVTMQSEKGMKILADCLNEFLDQVHPQYFHMGLDEVNVQNPAFMTQMAGLIRRHGCQLLVWRPGHLPGGKTITQLWSAGSAPNSPLPGLSAVDSRNDYINALDPFDAPLRMLNLATDGTSVGSALALGGTLCLWPDVNIGADQMNIYRQNPVFPALLAAAENYWHGGMVSHPENWTRLPVDTNNPAFSQFADFESRLIAHRDLYFCDWPFPYVKQTDIIWKVIGPFALENAPPVERDLREDYTVDGRAYRWVEARGATLFINHFWYGASVLPAAKTGVAYALTYVWSPRDQKVGFWIGFNDPIRSGRRGVPNPEPGEWSNVGSQIWINNQKVPPPHWKQPGVVDQANEIPFVDESYYFRPPTPVELTAGWNKILIRAPKTGQAFKWSVTCVPVRIDNGHCHEVAGLRFATGPGVN